VRPRLAVDLVRLAWSFRARDWWRRPPFLPLPPREYTRWRMFTAYGDEDAVPPGGRCGQLRPLAPRDDGVVNPVEQAAAIKRRATALGFAAAGVTTLKPNAHAPELDRWLEAGYAGTMTYLQRQARKRKEPALIMPQARAAVVTLTNYFHETPRHGRGDRHPRVAQYAWSADYHEVLGTRLEQLATAIRESCPGNDALLRGCRSRPREGARATRRPRLDRQEYDAHPSRDRSFTFIGVVLTDADLAPDLPFDVDRCGTCPPLPRRLPD